MVENEYTYMLMSGIDVVMTVFACYLPLRTVTPNGFSHKLATVDASNIQHDTTRMRNVLNVVDEYQPPLLPLPVCVLSLHCDGRSFEETHFFQFFCIQDFFWEQTH